MRHRRSISRPLLLVMATLLVGVFAFAGVASGQTRDEVRDALEKTDALLQSAQDIVTERGPGRGLTSLDLAKNFQARAWDAFNRNQMRVAFGLTERAREEIYRALNSVRPGEDNEGEVERQLERTDAILQEAVDRLQDRRAGLLRHRLESATNTQRRAWDLFHERQMRPALRLTLQARDMLLNLPGRGPGGDRMLPGGEVGIDTQLERLEAALGRVSDRLADTGNEVAAQHWEKARQALTEARRAYDEGEEDHADQLLRRTRTELETAMRLLMKDNRTEQVGALIASARERWDLVGGEVRESGDQRLVDWHEQANAHLSDAEMAHSKGNNQRALILTRRAIDLLDRISGETGL